MEYVRPQSISIFSVSCLQIKIIKTALYNERSGKYIMKRDVLLKNLNYFNSYCDMLPSRSLISNLYIRKLLYLVSIEYKAIEANVPFYILT